MDDDLTKTFAEATKDGLSDKPRVQSVARAAEILFAVAGTSEGATARQIVRCTGLPVQATYHLLHTLVSTGLLMRANNNRYILGFRVGTLADAFRHQVAPPEYLTPLVRRLSQLTGETAYAVGWFEGEIVTLSSSRGHAAVQATEVPHGLSRDAHARASGKLLLSYASSEDRDRYLATHPLNKLTANTIVDRPRLDNEFRKIRQDGYALDREEFTLGLACLAVPIDGIATSFALGLSAPADRFHKRFDEYLEMARKTASLRTQ